MVRNGTCFFSSNAYAIRLSGSTFSELGRLQKRIYKQVKKLIRKTINPKNSNLFLNQNLLFANLNMISQQLQIIIFKVQSHKQFRLSEYDQCIQTRSYIYRTVMSFRTKLLLILIFIWHAAAAKVLQKVLLDDPDALCLDGSPGSYFVHYGNSTKYLLNFEGGGWCGSPYGITESIQNCHKRGKHFLGSSTFYPPNVTFNQGVMSDNPKNIFRDWNVGYLRYCDGGGHQGYKKQPVQFKGEKVYFRGHNVTTGQLNSVDKKYNLFSQATEIVVTGQSAGGLATFMWSNYIKNRALNTTKVWAIPDSGIFLDSLNYNGRRPDYKIKFFNLLQLTNKEVDPPTEECVQANPTQRWKCMFAAHLYQHVKVPLFAINSLYDSWSLSYLLQMQCNYQSSLVGCNADKLKYIQEYKRNTSALVQKIAAIPTNGVWVPACSNHVYTLSDYFYSSSFRIPAGSRNSVAFAVKRWMDGEAGSHVYLDSVSWPGNAPCSGKRLLIQN